MAAGSAVRRWTYDDLARLPEDRDRHEIIDGVHIVTPAPRTKHQLVLGRLHLSLGDFVLQHRLGTVLVAPYDVVLSEHNVVEPDILFVRREHRERITERNLQGAPDLAVEVLSPGSHASDLVLKLRLYERFGVAEYWIVDPAEDTVTIHTLTDTAPRRYRARLAGPVLESALLPGWSLAHETLFAPLD